MTEGNEDKNIDTINMKIEILEKLIAENCTELEVWCMCNVRYGCCDVF